MTQLLVFCNKYIKEAVVIIGNGEKKRKNELFIVLEGLDGAGKTTLSKMLAQKLGVACFVTPPELLKCLRSLMDEKVSLQTRFLYYMLGNVLVSDQIREARKLGPVVCDRFVHSTLSYHKVLGMNVDIPDGLLNLEVPDFNFFIYTSDEEERRSRINNLSKKTPYDSLLDDNECRGRFMRYFLEKDEFIPIDTSHETEDESLAKIVSVIFERRV